MSSAETNKAPAIPQRIFKLLGGDKGLDRLGVTAYNCNDFAVRFLFGSPFFQRVTVMEKQGAWEILLADEREKELAVVHRVPDRHLVQWLRFFAAQLPSWVPEG